MVKHCLHIRMKVLGTLLLLVLLTGCASIGTRSLVDSKAKSASLVWPGPPHQPRIRYIRSVAKPKDFGIKPSFWKKLGKLLVGEEDVWFVRPTGVVAIGSVLYVADPGARALWVLDAEKGSFERIHAVGEEWLISPVAVAVGPDHSVYLADSALRRILVYKSAEGILENLIQDSGLQRPAGVAFDLNTDQLYVADSAAHDIKVYDRTGKHIRNIGQRGAQEGEFNFPTHIAVDRKGVVYVTDALGFRIQFFSSEGHFLGQFGRHGDSSGTFACPKGIAVDSDGHVYVVEALFDAVQIFDRTGQYLLTFGEQGTELGQFWLPNGIFIDVKNYLYVADSYNRRVQIFSYITEEQ